MYASDAVSASTSPSSPSGSAGGSAAGILAYGIFVTGSTGAAGSKTTTTKKYTYAGDTVAAATPMLTASTAGAAAGNATMGIFLLGSIANATNKYTYAGDTVTSTTSITGITTTVQGQAGTSNSNMAVFFGNAVANMMKYTFNTAVVTSAGNLGSNSYGGAGCNSGITGVNM